MTWHDFSSLDKLWDGQPVRYMCLNRKTEECYFAVVFQIAELEADNNLSEDDEDENDEVSKRPGRRFWTRIRSR